jgi:YcxB-like protein
MIPGVEIAVVARPTRAQLARVVRKQLLASSSTRTTVLSGFIGAPVLAVLYGLISEGRPLPLPQLLLVWAVGVTVALFFVVRVPNLSVRSPSSREFLEYGARYRFSDQSVFVRGAKATSDIQWTAFTGASRVDDCYTLRLSKVFCLIVPREAFRSPEEEQSFVTLVREKLGPKANV